MNVYIDESGVFCNPNNHSVALSCVGSLAIPGRLRKKVFKDFKKLRREWGVCLNDELKGSNVTENQFARIVEILESNYAVFTAVAIDYSYQDQSSILDHKQKQLEQIKLCPKEKMTNVFFNELSSTCYILDKMSPQLYVQSVCMKELISNTFRDTTFYYSKKSPETLSVFNWIIDSKNSTITDYECWLSRVVALFLQEESMNAPLLERSDGNYKALKHYYFKSDVLDARDHHSEHFYIDIGAIVRDGLSFKPSQEDLGLQLVDILTSCLRRSLRGNFQFEGWKYFSKVLFRSIKTKKGIYFITLTEQPDGHKRYYPCLDYLDDNARSLY